MHGGEHRDVETARLGIEQAAIAVDVALILQRPDATQEGWRRDADALGQYHIRDTAILLEFVLDLEVEGVELFGHGSPRALVRGATIPPSSEVPAVAQFYCAARIASWLGDNCRPGVANLA